MRLRKRRAAFKEKARAPGREPVIKNVQSPANPEVFFDILQGGAESARSRKETSRRSRSGAVMKVLKPSLILGLVVAGVGRSSMRSLTKSCIQIGSADMPARRSSRMADSVNRVGENRV